MNVFEISQTEREIRKAANLLDDLIYGASVNEILSEALGLLKNAVASVEKMMDDFRAAHQSDSK